MTKPIIFIDLETTGTSTTTDRIVQIAAYKKVVDGQTEKPRKYLINPTIPIPPAASEIHGITDEMVKDKPLFKQIVKGLLEYCKGCDFCGFNILDFDVPLLSEEITRAGFTWNIEGVKFFDSFRIFRDKEKRDLAAAVKFYTGKDHKGGHDAGEDIAATANVFHAQLLLYPDLGEMSPEQLAEYCAGGRSLDLAGKIILNSEGVPCFSFGKSKGTPVTKDLGFANWMLKNDFTTNTKEVVRRIISDKS